MDIFSDFKFWLFIYAVINGIIQWYLSTKITGIEVAKLRQDFEKLEHTYEIDKKARTDLLIQVSNDVAYIKGQLESDAKIIKILEKVINK